MSLLIEGAHMSRSLAPGPLGKKLRMSETKGAHMWDLRGGWALDCTNCQQIFAKFCISNFENKKADKKMVWNYYCVLLMVLCLCCSLLFHVVVVIFVFVYLLCCILLFYFIVFVFFCLLPIVCVVVRVKSLHFIVVFVIVFIVIIVILIVIVVIIVICLSLCFRIVVLRIAGVICVS